MRRKKKERLRVEAFWSLFCDINLPKDMEEIPFHLRRVNFRICGVNDEGLELMSGYIKSIVQLDLDETDITNEGIRHLTKLDSIKELRLKGCREIDNGCLPDLCLIKDLEFLHLGGTSISVQGLEKIGEVRTLKRIMISASDDEQIFLPKIADALPPGCDFTVNYQSYNRD